MKFFAFIYLMLIPFLVISEENLISKGIIRNYKGLCLTSKKAVIYLRKCRDLYFSSKGGRDQFWNYTEDKTLYSFDSKRCLSQKKDILVLEKCTPNNARQKWIIKKGAIKNGFSGQCLHSRSKRKISVKNCDSSKKGQWTLYGRPITIPKKLLPCKIPRHIRLNEARFVRAHNAYETQHFTHIKNSLDQVHVIEIDLSFSKIPRRSRKSIYVSHGKSYDENNCGPKGNGGFKTCLLDIKNWHEKNTGHDFKIIVINIKAFIAKRSRARKIVFEQMLQNIQEVFPRTLLYTPEDRKGGFEDMRTALLKSPWPMLGELKGKFMFTLNVGPVIDRGRTVNQYLKMAGKDTPIFVCPFANDDNDLKFSGNWEEVYPQHQNKIACATIPYESINEVLKTSKEQMKNFIIDVWNPTGPIDSFIRSSCFKGENACASDPRGFKTLVKTGASFIEANFPQSLPWARDGLRGKEGCPFL